MTPARAWEELASDLESLFRRGVREPLGDGHFNQLALRVFRHQYDGSATYRAFCEARGAKPENVHRWEDVPAVPARGFRHVDLLSAPGPEAVFLTSGTSGGAGLRGRHLVPRLSLYRASALPNFREHLLPEGRAVALLSLLPSPEVAPESSLSAMIGMVAEALAEDVAWIPGDDGPGAVNALRSAASRIRSEERPVLLVGTAFAFVHLLDTMAAEGVTLRLPPGTRIMETGGFKGRSRVLEREALYEGMARRLGVPAERIVNEYGMTELLSQLYEPVLTRRGPHSRRHVAPPWLRVRALHPATLAPVAPGTPGLLAFFDLANAGSVAHVLTEDVGEVSDDGVKLVGRSPGAEPRGCSLATEELVLAAKEAV